MSRRKQHFKLLAGDNFALCGKEVGPRGAITPYEWFPMSFKTDCETCIRWVRSHFFRQRRTDFEEMLEKENKDG